MRAELDLSPADWALRRQELLDKDNGRLLRELRAQPYGENLVVSVVDALMRAVPHELALNKFGVLLNALLARKPVKRFAK